MLKYHSLRFISDSVTFPYDTLLLTSSTLFESRPLTASLYFTHQMILSCLQ